MISHAPWSPPAPTEAACNAIRLTGATSRFSKVVEQLLRRLSLASARLARDQHLPLCYGRRWPHVHHATVNGQRTLLTTCNVHYSQHAACNIHYSNHVSCNMQLTKCKMQQLHATVGSNGLSNVLYKKNVQPRNVRRTQCNLRRPQAL